MRLAYYWACEWCGASPLPAKDRRWFETESAALDAGKPEECSNRYCYTRPESPYHTQEHDGLFRVHVIEGEPR